MNLFDSTSVREFLNELAAEHVKPAKVVIDTLGRSMDGADENSNSHLNTILGAADTIRRETGAAVLLIHHAGNNHRTPRGASALRGGVAMYAKISRKDDTLTLTCEKQKDAAPFDPVTLTLHEVADSLVLVGENDTLRTAPAPKPRRFKRIQVEAALRGLLNPQPSDLVARLAGMTPDNARQWIKTFRDDGTLDRMRFQMAG